MKLKHIFCISFVSLFFACSNNSEEEITAKQDSIHKAERTKAIAEEKKKNIYLIEPPDTNYTGDYLDKYDNGNVKFKGFFRFGKRHGQWLAFYANGILWSECFYDKGLKHGANNVYFENGKPRYNGWYKQDLRDSLWVFYDEKGTEIKRSYFQKDLEIGSR